jgi:hypothetical protein
VLAQGDVAVAVDGAVDLERGGARVERRQGRRAGGAPAAGGERGQIRRRQVRADGLDPGPTGEQVDQLVVGPEGDRLPDPGRPEPELLAANPEVAPGRHDPFELHRPTPINQAGRR